MGDIDSHRPVYWFGKLATRQSDGATFDVPVSEPGGPENTNPLGLWRTNHSHCPSPLRSAVTQVVSSPERRISPPGLRALMRWSSVVEEREKKPWEGLLRGREAASVAEAGLPPAM